MKKKIYFHQNIHEVNQTKPNVECRTYTISFWVKGKL